MTTIALPAAQVIADAGYLMLAPLGTALPAMVAAGGSYAADPWPAGWYSPGPTKGGTKLDINITTADLEVAEQYEPIDIRTTKRMGTVTFELANNTASNIVKAVNGGISTVVSGAGLTLSTKVSLPGIGSEVDFMIGFESQLSEMRFICYVVKNSGNISMQFAKAPNYAGLTFTAMLIKPATTQMVDTFYAGSARS